MTYPYPIPGSSTATPVYTGPYFAVGNECCGGGYSQDVAAKVKVTLDYTSELPLGVNVASIIYTITPVGDEMILISNQVLTANVATFMVSGGVVGFNYGIEALATLSDGQIWVDHITVSITDCGANVSSSGGSTLLSTFGPLVISNTLYYAATSEQTVFNLSVPDKFGHTGVLADHNVLVYEAGGRQVPYDNYNVSVGANTVTFISPLSVGEIAVFDIVNPPPPAPVIPPPILLESGIISTTLYYTGVQGQTVFSLGIPDEFGNVGEMTANGVQVYRSGNRLTFTDGYTLDVTNNRVTLVYPAGDDEPIIIELTTVPPTAAVIGIVIKMEALTITVANTIPALSYAPNGVMMMLFVNGTAFFSIGPNPAFTVSGNVLTWVSTLYSLPPGAAVIAVYTHV